MKTQIPQEDKHYVYKITNNKPTDKRLYYIGVKSSPHPESDNYYGSSNYLDEAIEEIGKEYFSKSILSYWNTREEANEEEIRLHWEIDVAGSEEYYNMANATSTGFCTKGMVPVLDTRDNSTKNVTKDEYYKCDFYVSTNFGTVPVFDKRDGLGKRVSREEYLKNYYFVSTQKGLTKAFDKKLNKIVSCTTIELKTNDNLTHFNKNKMAIKDLKDGISKQVTVDEYNNNDNYISNSKGKVAAYNKLTSKIESISLETFRNNKNYESCHKDKVLVKLEDGTSKKINKSEFKSGKYKTPASETVSVIDTRDNSRKRVSIDEYKSNDFFVNPNTKKINIFDTNGNIQYTVYGSFDKFCREQGLPAAALGKSFRNNNKVYEFSKPSQITKLKKDGLYKFKGWYARLAS